MQVRAVAFGNVTTKREILDENPNRRSVFLFNASGVTSGILIYLGDQSWYTVNLQMHESFSMNKVDDGYTGKILAYDSAGLATLYVTEISD